MTDTIKQVDDAGKVRFYIEIPGDIDEELLKQQITNIKEIFNTDKKRNQDVRDLLAEIKELETQYPYSDKNKNIDLLYKKMVWCMKYKESQIGGTLNDISLENELFNQVAECVSLMQMHVLN